MGLKFKVKKSKSNSTPFPLETLHERLVKDHAIDMRDNFIIKELEGDYIKVSPIDNTKLYK